MNNENDIRQEFNNMFENNTQENVQPYRATHNYNQVNPQQFVNTNNEINNSLNNGVNNFNSFQQMNMNNFVQSANDNQVLNNGYNNNQMYNNTYENNSQVLSNENNNISNISNDINNNLVQSENNVLYDTTSSINSNMHNVAQNTVKRKKTTVKINPELKGIFILVVALLVSMALIPSLFDIIDNLKLKIFG